MADALDSKSSARKGVWVQVPPSVSNRSHFDLSLYENAGRLLRSAFFRLESCPHGVLCGQSVQIRCGQTAIAGRSLTAKGTTMQIWKKQTIRWTVNGKRVQRGTPKAKRVVILSKRFYGTLKTFDSRKKQKPLTEDANTSRKLLRRLQATEDEKRANGVDSFHDERKCKLIDHLGNYLTFLRAKDNTPLHVETQAARIRKLFATTKAKTLVDLDGSRILATLAVWRSRKTKPMSVGTSNHYLIAIKGFSRWLWTERKSPDDPLAGLRRLNVDAGRRRIRRALTSDELQHLALTTQNSQRTYRGKDWRLTPTDRTMLYRLAAFTGLRVQELRSLRRSSFDLDTKTLTVEASNTKNRKKATLPIHPALTAKLYNYFATLKGEELFPGRWNENRRAGKFFQRDLKRAGIANVDELGRRVDFHSLRYTFITSLALAGVHPAKAQRLARHSDINLTMGVYTSLNVDDLRDAISSIPWNANRGR